jgi:4,5-dihydroxyphthalate decarboxylase
MSVQQTPGGKSLVAMLAAGAGHRTRRGNAQAQAGNTLRLLFADAIAEGKRFYDLHGCIPANHCYMVRGSLAREHPAIVANLYRAFHESKIVAGQSLSSERQRALLFGNEQLAMTCESFAGDPFSYGIDSNRAMLETVVELCQEQGLVRGKSSIEQLFVK